MSDDDITERYIERAAVMEYDAGFTRLEATSDCYKRIAKWCMRVGREVPKAIIDDYKTITRGQA